MLEVQEGFRSNSEGVLGQLILVRLSGFVTGKARRGWERLLARLAVMRFERNFAITASSGYGQLSWSASLLESP
jgi:hypothetical protein